MSASGLAGAFAAVCGGFGFALGLVGLGFGLVFLSVPQAVGVGVLSTGGGMLLGLLLGGKVVFRALIQTLEDMQRERKGG